MRSLWKNPKPSFLLLSTPFILPSLLPTVAPPRGRARVRWWKEHVSRNRSHYRGFEADRNSNERKLETSVEIFILHCFSPVLSEKSFSTARGSTLLEDAEFFNSSPSLTKLAPPRSNLTRGQFDDTMIMRDKEK